MKVLTITMFMIALSISAQDIPLYEQVTSNIPVLGEKTEVYLGDRMLIQREGEYRECVVPKRTFEVNALMENCPSTRSREFIDT